MRNQPDERLVYLALKNVFRGADAQLRKSKKIRELILRQQHSIDVKDLIEAHNIDNVCNVAKSLLEQQLFESTLKAKIRFPEVFEVSPAQSAERSVSEREAARTEAEAIQCVAEGSSRPVLGIGEDGNKAGPATVEVNAATRSAVSLGKRKEQHLVTKAPSLYPVYLPLPAQHKLLVTVQQALERACYSFAVTSLPELIAEHEEWDCAEAVELNIWARILAARPNIFAQADVDEAGKPLDQLFDSIAQLRHTAVHRLRVSATRLDTFLTDAGSLATLLHDERCKQQVSRLRHDMYLVVEDIKRNKDLLESQLAAKMRQIAAQRMELDRLEHSVTTDMLREDHEYLQYAGTMVTQAIDAPETAVQSAVGTEQDPESDVDVVNFPSNNLDTTST